MDLLSHVDESGGARMVDVSEKTKTIRRATAEGIVRMSQPHLDALQRLPKGDALVVAQIAGIQAAKKAAELIPLCHPLPLSQISVELARVDGGVRVVAQVATTAETGVEMEALTAVSVAALTLYDMIKAVGHDIEIAQVRLLEKTGGKSDWKRE
jgi:cyclic pyranopterin phosphate synthase